MKFYLNGKTLLSISVLFILIVSAVNTTTRILVVSAQVPPWLEVTPSPVEKGPNPPSAVGRGFRVEIHMKDLDSSWQLFNVSLALTFNSTLLRAVNVDIGDFFDLWIPAGRKQKTVFNETVQTDRIIVNQYHIDEAPENRTYPPKEGKEIIAFVDFDITYQGEYPEIDENVLTIIDVELTDKDGNPVPVDVAELEHGLYRIRGLSKPRISVINPSTEDSNFTFTTNTISLSQPFNATLWIYDITDLFAWQIRLEYNTSQLVATKLVIPTRDPSYVFYGRQNVPLSFNGTNYVTIADTILVGETFNGTGKLGIVEFKILEAPQKAGNVSSYLSIDNVDTNIQDSDTFEVPLVKISGYYEYVWKESLPGLEVKPSTYTAVELETFNVTVWLNNVNVDRGLISLEFKLRYNSTLLNPIQVIEEPLLAGFGFTFNYYFGVGNITIKHDMNPPYTNFPYGSGSIATITFQGIYQNSKENNCTLEFVDILLQDENRTEIPTAPPINGLYKILSFGSSILSIDVNPASVEVESDIVISGTLKPTRQNVTIAIHYRTANEAWNTLATTETDSHSNYTFTWTTTNVDTYEIKANWLGDENTNPAESEIKTVTVLAKPSTIDYILYAAVGAGTIIAAVAIAVYFLKIRKH